jgi:hypothetical protein
LAKKRPGTNLDEKDKPPDKDVDDPCGDDGDEAASKEEQGLNRSRSLSLSISSNSE